MYRIIAIKDGEVREFKRRCDCANAFNMGVDVLNRLIKTGQTRNGWSYDYTVSTDEDCGVRNYSIDNVRANLLSLIAEHRVPVKDLADVCDCSPCAVQSWLSGRTTINAENLLKIAQFFELDSIDELYEVAK